MPPRKTKKRRASVRNPPRATSSMAESSAIPAKQTPSFGLYDMYTRRSNLRQGEPSASFQDKQTSSPTPPGPPDDHSWWIEGPHGLPDPRTYSTIAAASTASRQAQPQDRQSTQPAAQQSVQPAPQTSPANHEQSSEERLGATLRKECQVSPHKTPVSHQLHCNHKPAAPRAVGTAARSRTAPTGLPPRVATPGLHPDAATGAAAAASPSPSRAAAPGSPLAAPTASANPARPSCRSQQPGPGLRARPTHAPAAATRTKPGRPQRGTKRSQSPAAPPRCRSACACLLLESTSATVVAATDPAAAARPTTPLPPPSSRHPLDLPSRPRHPESVPPPPRPAAPQDLPDVRVAQQPGLRQPVGAAAVAGRASAVGAGAGV